MFFVLVRCYDHWFCPHMPVNEKQAVFKTAAQAEEAAATLSRERPKSYREIKVVAA